MPDKIPKILYRGIRFDHENYPGYQFTQDIPLPDKYIIDQEGRKCVTDGNEYGIYMSTNREMAANYAMPTVYDTSPIGQGIYVGESRMQPGLPAIGVLTEIDTEGLSIKEPYISPTLAGHYNNGYQGKEYISTEPVPFNNISYSEVTVGPDMLYDAVTYKNVGAAEIKPLVDKEIANRQESLTKLYEFFEKESPAARLRVDYKSCRESFQKIFVDDCLQKTEFDLSTRSGLHEAMLSKTNEQNGTLTLKDIKNITRDIDSITQEDIRSESPEFKKLFSKYSLPKEENVMSDNENSNILSENIDKVERVLDELQDKINKSQYTPGTNAVIEAKIRDMSDSAQLIKENLDKYEMSDIIASEEYDVTTDEIEDIDALEEVKVAEIEDVEEIEDIDSLKEISDINALEENAEELEDISLNVSSDEQAASQYVFSKQMVRQMIGWVPPEQRGESSFINELHEMGLTSKEDIKAYLRTEVMPSDQQMFNNMAMQNTQQQASSYDMNRQQAKEMFAEPDMNYQNQEMQQGMSMQMRMQPA